MLKSRVLTAVALSCTLFLVGCPSGAGSVETDAIERQAETESAVETQKTPVKRPTERRREGSGG